MPIWDAEIVLDGERVRRLLARFDALALDSVEQLAEGWDRSAWLVDGSWVFGFPRRAAVVPGLVRELDFLPRLAPLLPLRIPEPVFAGWPEAGGDYPWPFYGYALIPGSEAGDAPSADRRSRALELAAFLRVLHAAATLKAIGGESLPLDANGRSNMAARLPRARGLLAELRASEVPPAAGRILREAEMLPPPAPPRVVHGDLHARQLLVEGARLTGVIDWVDLGRADPAIDLQFLWSAVDPGDRDDVASAYGEVTEAQLLIARVTALWLNAAVAISARDVANATVERDALAALERAATD